uniref:amphiphysin-like isoform X2 n=1 Tax=Styela clava TaxID=7725 RepID=UPI001939A4A9|nr:amphiphysin-like isoform X2 [Styela clava]
MADSQVRDNSSRIRRNMSKLAYRSKEKVMRSIGRAEETKDEILDHYVMLINKQQLQMQKLHRDMKQYLAALRAMSLSQKAFYDSLYEVYDDDWAGKDVIASCSQRNQLLHDDIFARFQAEVTDTLQNHLTEYNDCKLRVEKRSRKLVDYDAARRTLQSLEASRKPDPTKLQRAQEHVRITKERYEELNSQLHEQLPTLYDSRLPVCTNTFSSICESEKVFSNEIAEMRDKLNNVLLSLKSAFDGGQYHIQRMRPPMDNGRVAATTSSSESAQGTNNSSPAKIMTSSTVSSQSPTKSNKEGSIPPRSPNDASKSPGSDPSTHEYVNLQVGSIPDVVRPVTEEDENTSPSKGSNDGDKNNARTLPKPRPVSMYVPAASSELKVADDEKTKSKDDGSGNADAKKLDRQSASKSVIVRSPSSSDKDKNTNAEVSPKPHKGFLGFLGLKRQSKKAASSKLSTPAKKDADVAMEDVKPGEKSTPSVVPAVADAASIASSNEATKNDSQDSSTTKEAEGPPSEKSKHLEFEKVTSEVHQQAPLQENDDENIHITGVDNPKNIAFEEINKSSEELQLNKNDFAESTPQENFSPKVQKQVGVGGPSAIAGDSDNDSVGNYEDMDSAFAHYGAESGLPASHLQTEQVCDKTSTEGQTNEIIDEKRQQHSNEHDLGETQNAVEVNAEIRRLSFENEAVYSVAVDMGPGIPSSETPTASSEVPDTQVKLEPPSFFPDAFGEAAEHGTTPVSLDEAFSAPSPIDNNVNQPGGFTEQPGFGKDLFGSEPFECVIDDTQQTHSSDSNAEKDDPFPVLGSPSPFDDEGKTNHEDFFGMDDTFEDPKKKTADTHLYENIEYTQGQKPEIQGQQPETQGQNQESQFHKLETQGQKLETQGQKLEIQGQNQETQGQKQEAENVINVDVSATINFEKTQTNIIKEEKVTETSQNQQQSATISPATNDSQTPQTDIEPVEQVNQETVSEKQSASGNDGYVEMNFKSNVATSSNYENVSFPLENESFIRPLEVNLSDDDDEIENDKSQNQQIEELDLDLLKDDIPKDAISSGHNEKAGEMNEVLQCSKYLHCPLIPIDCPFH